MAGSGVGPSACPSLPGGGARHLVTVPPGGLGGGRHAFCQDSPGGCGGGGGTLIRMFSLWPLHRNRGCCPFPESHGMRKSGFHLRGGGGLIEPPKTGGGGVREKGSMDGTINHFF